MKRSLVCALFAALATVVTPAAASAAVILGPYTGTLDGSDAFMAQRLSRSDPPSTCAVPQPGVVFGGADVRYETFTFFNSGPAECVTVTYSSLGVGDDYDHLSAYVNSFNPSNLLLNYLADAGNSAGGGPAKVFSFMVPADTPFVIVANSVFDPTAGPFSFTVSGDSINAGRVFVSAPEPATLALLGLGVVGWRARRRQR